VESLYKINAYLIGLWDQMHKKSCVDLWRIKQEIPRSIYVVIFDQILDLNLIRKSTNKPYITIDMSMTSERLRIQHYIKKR
jgi:hypothetical protein